MAAYQRRVISVFGKCVSASDIFFFSQILSIGGFVNAGCLRCACTMACMLDSEEYVSMC